LDPKPTVYDACYSSEQLIVFRVRANPKPQVSVVHVDSQRTVVLPNADGPQVADLLEVQRRMPRV
jgi:hypothetical protein